MRERDFYLSILSRVIILTVFCFGLRVCSSWKDSCTKNSLATSNEKPFENLLKKFTRKGLSSPKNVKHWLRYRDKSIVKAFTQVHCLCDSLSLQKTLMELLRAENMVRILRLPITLFPRPFIRMQKYKIKNRIHRVTEVLSSIQSQGISVFSLGAIVVPFRFSYRFTLQKDQQLVMAVKKLTIFGVVSLCEFNAKVVAGGEQFSKMLFCGLYSDLMLYPPSNSVRFSLRLGPVTNFCMQIFFNLMSPNIIHTVAFSVNENREFFRIHLTAIWPVKDVLHLKYFKSEKWTQLRVKVTSLDSVYLYDGPGLLSNRSIIYANRNGFSCSSFQCVLQTKSAGILFEVLYMSFVNLDSPWSTVTKSDTNVSDLAPIVNLQNSSYSGTRTYFFISSHITVFNISIFSLKSWGEHHPNCLHAGLALDYASSSTLPEEETLCDTENFVPRSLYTASNETVLVLYGFEHYGGVTVSLSVTITHCQVVKINMCLFFKNLLQQSSERSHIFSGPYRDVYQNVRNQARPVVVLNATGYHCTVAQVFSKPIQQCTHLPHIAFLDSVNQYWFKIFLHVIFEEKAFHQTSIVDSSLLRSRGLLVSAGHTSESKHLTEMSELLLSFDKSDIFENSETEVYDNSITLRGDQWLTINKNISIIEFSEGKQNLLDVHYNSMRSRIFGEGCYENNSCQSIHVRPPKHTNWVFQFDAETNVPIHEDSLHFYVEMVGFKSWIDIVFQPAQISRTEGEYFFLRNQKLNVFVEKPQAVLLFSIEKEHLLNKPKIEISASLATKASERSFLSFKVVCSCRCE